jgi:cytoskeletal protein CcmA (bactofilin family)
MTEVTDIYVRYNSNSSDFDFSYNSFTSDSGYMNSLSNLSLDIQKVYRFNRIESVDSSIGFYLCDAGTGDNIVPTLSSVFDVDGSGSVSTGITNDEESFLLTFRTLRISQGLSYYKIDNNTNSESDSSFTLLDPSYSAIFKKPLLTNDSMDVSGNIYIHDSATFHDSVSILGGLDISGSMTLKQSLDVSGAVTLQDTLDVSNAATFHSSLHVVGDVSMGGNIIMSGGTINNNVTYDVSVNSGMMFTINGVDAPELTLMRGFIYNFDQTSSSGHPIGFTTSNTTVYADVSYTSGVSINGVVTTFIVPQDAPDQLYYECQNDTNMGNAINIVHLAQAGSSGSGSGMGGVWTQDDTTGDISYGGGTVSISGDLHVMGDISGYIHKDTTYTTSTASLVSYSSSSGSSSGSGLAGVWTRDAFGDISYGGGNVFIGAGLDVSGELTVGGDVSANAFYGDGSNLTGISWVGTATSALNMGSNNITNVGSITATGTVSANSFAGDGSSLTGISSSWVGTADSDLNMGSKNITNVSKLETAYFQLGSVTPTSTYPIEVNTSGILRMTSSTAETNFACLIIKRSMSNGALIGFYKGGSIIGSIYATSNSTIYNTGSDYRLKENVIEMTGAIDIVNQLQPVRFNFISDPSKNIVDGFLAHQVSDICPQAVTGEKDAMKINRETGVEEPDYQGIDQSKLVPLLVGAVQELKAEKDALQTSHDALQTSHDALKALLQSKGLLD